MERTLANAIAAIAVAGALIAGCNPISGVGTPAPTDTPSPGLNSPSSAATTTPLPEATCDSTGNSSRTDFGRGTATLRFTSGNQNPVTLDRIGNTTFRANFDPACPGGAQAEWTDSSDQWLLAVLASMRPNDPATGQQRGMLWIDGGATDPPLYADGARCKVSITDESPSGLVGHAECQGLRWLNGYEAKANPNAKPLPNMPPFDVSITFEAQP
jgi:hypothetical protein